jgi:hypothetical protein
VTWTLSATLDTNDQVFGPFSVRDKATVIVAVTGTITVTPQCSHTQSSFLALTSQALTSSGALVLEGPGVWRLVASGVSGGSAAVSAQVS